MKIEIHLPDKEEVRIGMRMLERDLKEPHWFFCKECAEVWQSDSHCTEGKCPACGIPKMEPDGPTQKIFGVEMRIGGGVRSGENGLLLGIWDNIEGIDKQTAEGLMYLPKDIRFKMMLLNNKEAKP